MFNKLWLVTTEVQNVGLAVRPGSSPFVEHRIVKAKNIREAFDKVETFYARLGSQGNGYSI